MDDLIAKLEAAPTGLRELDAEIADYMGVPVRTRRTRGGANKGRQWFVDSKGGVETWSQDPPAYTTSLDAALMLVPEGYHWTLEPDTAWVRWDTGDDVGETQGALNGRGGKQTALALCVAALKARQAMAAENAA